MLRTIRVKTTLAAKIPAAVHVDGTSRVQVVRNRTHPNLHRILGYINEWTRVPILLNTSFNVMGEPLVETPDDALSSFVQMPIDLLYIDGNIYEKLGAGPLRH